MTRVHGYRERAHLALVVDRKRGVRHGAADMAADDRGGHFARALERNVGRLETESSVQALMRSVVRRVQARAAERELVRLLLRGLDEVLERLDGARFRNDQRIRRV